MCGLVDIQTIAVRIRCGRICTHYTIGVVVTDFTGGREHSIIKFQGFQIENGSHLHTTIEDSTFQQLFMRPFQTPFDVDS